MPSKYGSLSQTTQRCCSSGGFLGPGNLGCGRRIREVPLAPRSEDGASMTASSPEAEVVVFAGAKVEGAFLSGTAAAAQMQVLL